MAVFTTLGAFLSTAALTLEKRRCRAAYNGGVQDPGAVSPEERQTRRLRILAETSRAFEEAATDVDGLLQLVARRFAELIGDGCYIRLVASDGVTLEPVATYHPDPEIEQYMHETTDKVPLRIGEGISGRVVETGEPLFMPEISVEQYKKMTTTRAAPAFERVGISSLIVVRLRCRSTNLGFIGLVRHGVGRPAYTEDDFHLVRDLAERAALAIDSARLLKELEDRVEQRTRELERTNRELESTNRELEAFSYSVSHDLRAPLRAIDGFSLILEEEHGASLDEDAKRVLGVIRKNTKRMGQLIDDLLRFSRLGRLAMTPVNVAMQKLVESIIEELRAAESSRSLEFRIADLPPAVCDPQLIRQVWINLLGNAVKYTRTRPQAVIQVAGSAEERELRYTITDNGSGFDPKYSNKLFGVFQRLHSSTEFEGTGVGLALVQRIVARHGGRVWADGRLNEGATFGFALPRRRDA